ncbi:5-oxoprolinase subunit PxpA [Tundrisphaera lichenicola]|uniref:5-oxoprolinase subunit PxpA n=1 Tax=Tundrisphaera lichenicola TaxID=2029860 RepID=UPI003EB812F2
MTRTIDLNADLGEGCPWDRPLLERVTSASLACGAHAGDPETIRQTLRWAGNRGVVVGAHPGYPDRAGFGRSEKTIPTEELTLLIERQIRDLSGWAGDEELSLQFLKPHGALYNQAQRDRSVAEAVMDAARTFGLPVLGLPGGEVERLAIERGHSFLSEGFADRRYQPDGRLVPRTEPNALLHEPDEIRAQVLYLLDRGIRTICIHGDDPRSVELADLVLSTLRDAGIEPRSFA